MKNFDSYYDPPEEPETPICEECGQDMEENGAQYKSGTPFYYCKNPFCPGKFRPKSVEHEMAQELVDALDTVSTLKAKVTLLSNQLDRCLSDSETEIK